MCTYDMIEEQTCMKLQFDGNQLTISKDKKYDEFPQMKFARQKFGKSAYYIYMLI